MKIDKRFDELMTFAATEATIALSELLKQPMTVEIMDVAVINKNKMEELNHDYPIESDSIVMTTSLVGTLHGMGAFILPPTAALSLCDVLLHRKVGTTSRLQDLEESALLESGNIVIGCFLNALGYVSPLNNILHKKLVLSKSSMEKPFKLYYADNSDRFIVRTAFRMKHVNIEGICVFYFDTADVLERL